MTSQDLQNAGVKLSPPVAMATMHLVGISLPDWVAIATLFYILLQIADLLWKWRRRIHAAGGTGE